MHQQIKCDVLVIGGGGAALKAAISAKMQGTDVLIASKGIVGKSGATYYSVAEVGAFNVPDGSLDPTDNPAAFFEDIKNASKSMARLRLSEILANNAIEALHELEALPNGHNIFAREIDGRYKVYRACFSTKARSHVVQNHFKPIIKVLREEVERLNIRTMSGVVIIDLLVEDGQCCGAYALDDQGNAIIILAKSVVLATGGSSQLFYKNMYPADITGDGYAMAYRAGAKLTNMEFLQAGIGLAEPSINLFQNYLWGGKPHITNRHGDEILSKYLPPNISIEDVLKAKQKHFPFSADDAAKYIEVSIQSEINHGGANKRGNVSLKFDSEVIKNVMETDQNFSSMWPLTSQWYQNLGVDLEQEPIEVACFAHAVNGGVLIDENAESSIPGLFAAGETAAGPHGADRLGGNMSVTCQVFGKIAGVSAALFSKRQDRWISGQQAQQQTDEFIARFTSSGETTLLEILQQVQLASNEALLILRNENRIAKYLQELDQIEMMLFSTSSINNLQERTYAVCLYNLIETGKLMANAARFRKESRGSHYRTDYPISDSKCDRNIILEKGSVFYEL